MKQSRPLEDCQCSRSRESVPKGHFECRIAGLTCTGQVSPCLLRPTPQGPFLQNSPLAELFSHGYPKMVFLGRHLWYPRHEARPFATLHAFSAGGAAAATELSQSQRQQGAAGYGHHPQPGAHRFFRGSLFKWKWMGGGKTKRLPLEKAPRVHFHWKGKKESGLAKVLGIRSFFGVNLSQCWVFQHVPKREPAKNIANGLGSILISL